MPAAVRIVPGAGPAQLMGQGQVRLGGSRFCARRWPMVPRARVLPAPASPKPPGRDPAPDEVPRGQSVRLLEQVRRQPFAVEEPAPVEAGVSQVLPKGSLDSLLGRWTRRCRRPLASRSNTSRKVGRASP